MASCPKTVRADSVLYTMGAIFYRFYTGTAPDVSSPERNGHMTRTARPLFVALLPSRKIVILGVFMGFALAWSTPARANVYTSPTCNESDVQATYNTEQASKADGDVIILPSCPSSAVWSSTLSISPSNALTVQGQTTCTGTPASSCTDNTVITDGIGSDNPVLLVNTTSGKSFRLTGLTIANNTFTPEYGGALVISGGSTAVRIDHCHFNNLNEVSVTVAGVYGVMDHSIITENGVNWNGIKYKRPGPDTLGDTSWNTATQLGSANFFFVEDSTITNGFSNDCQFGGRFVMRHNNLLLGAGVQEHGTGSGGNDERGCRAFEVYQNTMTGKPSCSGACFTAGYMMTGTGVFWGNTVDSNFQHVMVLHSIRRSNAEYTMSPTPTGWGYCGTSFNGTGSNWDQNSNTTNGYACLDMLGRGQGDLLSGLAPSKVNSTNGNIITWPRQSLEPVYMWQNTWTGTPTTNYTVFTENVNPNQDVYDWCDPSSTNGCTSFNGTAGVGSGLLSARPSTCSPNPTSFSGPYTTAPLGSSPGVGYFATDTNTLYVCTATNTWTSYYTPYAYPHPLTQVSSVSVSPPTNLQVIAQ